MSESDDLGYAYVVQTYATREPRLARVAIEWETDGSVGLREARACFAFMANLSLDDVDRTASDAIARYRARLNEEYDQHRAAMVRIERDLERSFENDPLLVEERKVKA
jgi:hypothetical protein